MMARDADPSAPHDRHEPHAPHEPPAILANADAFDPLRSLPSTDYIWTYVDSYFQPYTQDSIHSFRSLPPSSLKLDSALTLQPPSSPTTATPSSTAPTTPHDNTNNKSSINGINNNNSNMSQHTTVETRLNAHPLTQRLVASLLDVSTANGSGAPSTFALGDGTEDKEEPLDGLSPTAMGAVCAGKVSHRLRHHEALEERVKVELCAVGLLNGSDITALDMRTRMVQTRLREVKVMNSARLSAMITEASAEIAQQGTERKVRKVGDYKQMDFLNLMMAVQKKSKKSRSKFEKLFKTRFGHYQDKNDGKSGASKKNNQISKKGNHHQLLNNSNNITKKKDTDRTK